MIGKSVFVVALSSYNMKKSLFERDWGVEDFKMQKEKWKKVVMDILAEMLGSMLIALGIYNFALEAGFPMSGFSGLAMIIYRLTGLPIGVTTILLNIPVTLLCFRVLGKGFFFRSLRCMVISSICVDVIAPFLPVYQGDRMLSALCTGVLSGIGYAMIYMRNSSTGGADFVIMSLKAVKPHLSLGKIMFALDFLIVLLGGVIFQDVDGIIYGIIINSLLSLVVDKTMYGINSGKLALIVTERGKEVTEIIDERTGRGTTILHASGGYRQEDKQVVMCACNNKEMYLVEQAVKEIDDKSFMIMLESNEVPGEGFHVTRVAQTDEQKNRQL